MDQVVVDSSVAIKWYITEDHSAEARKLLDAYQQANLTLLAPESIYAEVGNIVWKKQMFQGLPEVDAPAILRAFRMLPLVLTPAADLVEQAYQLAVTHRRSVYDTLYLALSVREQCRFVTADEKLVNAVGAAFPNAVWIANWP